MYKGRRDDHVSLRIPQQFCYIYEAKSGKEFVEICLPGGNKKEWRSFMVNPSQVCYDYENPNLYNIIEGLNRDTKIKISTKIVDENAKRIIVPNTTVEYDPITIKSMF